MTRRDLLTILLTMAAVLGGGPPTWGAPLPPAGEVVIAFPVTIAPTWFDPAETPAQITPFALLYALHDGLVRPLPGERMGPSLAASWTESPMGWCIRSPCVRASGSTTVPPVRPKMSSSALRAIKGMGPPSCTRRSSASRSSIR